MSVTILTGDCRDMLDTLPAGSAQMCVTSPPYFWLRDYGHEGQIGLERSVDEYVDALVSVFRSVRRVLADDGTLWLNLGDSYARQAGNDRNKVTDGSLGTGRTGKSHLLFRDGNNRPPEGLKPKDLIGIPWRVALALQQDGWYLRSDIVWHKPNPIPESVTDRPTKAHEYLFLLAKSQRYYYDAAAIAEEAIYQPGGSHSDVKQGGFNDKGEIPGSGQRSFRAIRPTRNRRSVWSVPTRGYKGAHFAVMPEALVEPCILAGSREGDTVLDPFGGAGTTGLVADRLSRDAVLVELNPEYAQMARDRIYNDAPLFASVGGV